MSTDVDPGKPVVLVSGDFLLESIKVGGKIRDFLAQDIHALLYLCISNVIHARVVVHALCARHSR